MKAHGDVSHGGIFRFGQPAYEVRKHRDRSPYAHSYEQCTYCGSLSPAALEQVLALPSVKLSPADMKYGWPHKLYLDGVPNDVAGQTVVMGSESGPGFKRDILGAAPKTQMLKFYTEHLVDLDDDAFKRVAALIEAKTGIEFERDGDRMKWRRKAMATGDANGV